MRKIFLNLPKLKDLEKLLSETFPLSDSLTGADIIITEGELDFINGKLVISLSDKKRDSRNTVYISAHLSTEAIYRAIRASVDTYSITSEPVPLTPIYHVLKDSDPKVSYLVKKLESILNAAAESIVEIDYDGSILFHNKKFAEIYEAADSIIEGNIYSIFDTEAADAIRKAIASVTSEEPVDFSGHMKKRSGVMMSVEGHISALQGDASLYEIIFEDVTDKLRREQEAKKVEERAIIAGFSRHLSHNVMNALTAAGGFIRKVRAQTENSLHMQNLWHIINDKLMLIEEIVAGYNDYTHAISLRKTEKIDMAAFFEELVTAISLKQVDRNFTAYLYKFTDNYTLSCDFSKAIPFETEGSRMFLKLALCYILKDNIRYFSGNLPLEYEIKAETRDNNFILSILVKNVEVPEQIIETMLKPWDHQMLSQSFDYWGVMIAAAVMENHNGKVSVHGEGSRLRFDMVFDKVQKSRESSPSQLSK